MGKAPAFQLYAADFFMDTIGWSDVEVGIYIRLLLLEWINGPLPDDHKQLLKLMSSFPVYEFDERQAKIIAPYLFLKNELSQLREHYFLPLTDIEIEECEHGDNKE